MSDYTVDELEKLRYPIGKFAPKKERTAEERRQDIAAITRFAVSLNETVLPLNPGQLSTPYRPGGWSVTQLVHHLADTGMYAYLRFKKGLTEDAPHIPSYRQDLWAEQSDYINEPVESSLRILEGLHSRFANLLNSLEIVDFAKIFVSAGLGTMDLDTALQRYVWHNRHHMAQITELICRSGW
ncbi:putative metal-dependent hydrolase YfiT [compost metagenome]